MATGKTRAERLAVQVPVGMLMRIEEERGAWHESPAAVRAGLAWGSDKAILLAWVRARMETLLTARERHCVHLVFFEGLHYREAGRRTSTNASSVHRAVARGLRKLRAAAADDPVRAVWERHATSETTRCSPGPTSRGGK